MAALFKYFHPDRTDVLKGQSIRFSSPKVLNDPFELKPHVSALGSGELLDSEFDRLFPKLLEEEWAKLPPEVHNLIQSHEFYAALKAQLPKARDSFQQLSKGIVPSLQALMERKFEELIGLLCLTELPTSLLMWAHYADSHKGFVVEFDSEAPFFKQRLDDEDEFRHLRKVCYQASRPSIVLAEVQNFEQFLIKSNDWAYEAEWRMLMPLSMASQKIGDGPDAIHLFKFPASIIKTIVLGCQMKEQKKLEVQEVLWSNSQYSHVKLKQARIDNTCYRISIGDANL